MAFQEDKCIAILDTWIVKIKQNVFKKNVNSDIPENPENPESPENSENPEKLFIYKSYLEDLESKITKAITDENTQALVSLGWPSELMECITDMSIRSEILDHLKQAFTVHHFNKSPLHENELKQRYKL